MAARGRTVEHRPPSERLPAIEVVRSARRRRSASAFERDGRVVVQLPAGLPGAEEERLIASLVRRVTGQARAAAVGGDAALTARAAELADRHLDGVRPAEVRWSNRMRRRYGSCTPQQGTIRISTEVAAMPAYVLDYVLVHELAHLLEPDHSPAFHALVDRFPQAAQARGFLEGHRFALARATLATPTDDDPEQGST